MAWARAPQVLSVALAICVADCVYLSWRYIALHAGRVTPGTGLCSWSSFIDCDQVLLTPQANAFWVPNATLGLGFFGGCALWWVLGRRLGPHAQRAVTSALVAALGLGTLFTFYFFSLLVRLPHLCPFCPWNHAFTWIALGGAIIAHRQHPPERHAPPRRQLAALVVLCVGAFFAVQLIWALFLRPAS